MGKDTFSGPNHSVPTRASKVYTRLEMLLTTTIGKRSLLQAPAAWRLWMQHGTSQNASELCRFVLAVDKRIVFEAAHITDVAIRVEGFAEVSQQRLPRWKA